MSFGKNVGYYRRKLKITQEELAEHLYVSRQTISRWETDSVFPDVETIIKLCELFGCDMDTLIRGDAEKACEAAVVEDSEPDENEEKEKTAEEREHIKKWERRSRLAEKINGVICSVVMTVAIFAYLLCGLLEGIWHPTWIIFIAATGICAISSIITNAIE